MDVSRRLLVFCIFALVFFSFSSADAVEFLSYDDAISVARDEDKDVYVLFGGENCPWCHKQKDTLSKGQLTGTLSKYIVCYVDVDAQTDIARRYRVRAIPVSMVLDGEERIVRKNVGYMDESKFLNWIR